MAVYVVMMATALVLIIVGWTVVGGLGGLVMSVVAALLVPLAAIVANAGREDR